MPHLGHLETKRAATFELAISCCPTRRLSVRVLRRQTSCSRSEVALDDFVASCAMYYGALFRQTA